MAVAPPTLAALADRLTAAGCVAAAREAAELLAAADDERTLDAWVRRREQGEPQAWITGSVRFCGQTLHVAPGVYVPHVQSEELYVPTGELRLLPADVQRHEPRLTLDGGADGLDHVRRTVAAAARLLRPGGWPLLEVGGNQDERLATTLAAAAVDLVTPWWDDEGDVSGIAARATGQGA